MNEDDNPLAFASRRECVEALAVEIDHALDASLDRALVLVGERRETLVLVSRDHDDATMLRATAFWTDGPVGHVTRSTSMMIAAILAEDYWPVRLRRVSRVDVDAWTSTPDFVDGSARVAAIQAENEQRRS